MSEVQPVTTPTEEQPRVPVSQADDWDDSTSIDRQAEAEARARQAAVEPPPVEKPDGAEEPPAPPIDRTRHRARSQEARAKDVPRIAELTKARRDAERERDALKARLDELEKRVPQPSQDSAPVVAAAVPEFSEAEPDLNAYLKAQEEGKTPDGYRDYLADFSEWTRQRKAHESRAAQAPTDDTKIVERLEAEFRPRATEFLKAHPDYNEVIAKAETANERFTPLLHRAVLALDNGPEVAYALAQRPEFFAEAQLLTTTQPVTAATVANTQRWLKSRVQAATTRSAAPTQPKRTPQPLNLVRTQADSLRGSSPPGDAGSLEDHISTYHVPGRGRRR